MNDGILNSKILDISLEHDDIIEFFKKHRFAGIPKYTGQLETMTVPYGISKRCIDSIRIIQENNIIIIKFSKYEAVNAWSILWREVGYSDYTNKLINEIRINGYRVTDETLQNYISMLLYKNTISTHFGTIEEARKSTGAIYYKIKSTRCDDYFFNKEYDRIKKTYKEFRDKNN